MKCPSCGEEFGAYYWLYLRWCKHSETYRCGRCCELGNQCDSCEFIGKNRLPDTAMPMTAAVALVFISLILPLAIGGFISGYTHYKWESMEVSPIANCEDGDLVKLKGTIAMSDDWEMSGREEKMKSSYRFFPEFKPFTMSDDSCEIHVRADRNMKIYASEHGILTEHEAQGFAYRNGDPIVVIGTVRQEANGDLFLEADVMAPQDTVFEYEHSINVSTGLLILYFILVGYAVYRARMRLILHTTNSRKFKPRSIDYEHIDKEVGKTVNNNARPVFIALYASLFMIIQAGVIYAFLFSVLPMNGSAGDFCILGIFSVFSFFLISAVIYHWKAPTRIGTSIKGIHFDYATRRLNLALRSFIPWTDVERICRMAYGSKRSSYWAIGMKDGSRKCINPLSPGARKEIINAFKAFNTTNDMKTVTVEFN